VADKKVLWMIITANGADKIDLKKGNWDAWFYDSESQAKIDLVGRFNDHSSVLRRVIPYDHIGLQSDYWAKRCGQNSDERLNGRELQILANLVGDYDEE